MSVKKFRFVSPGIFINEIDNSQLPGTGEGIGPVVIGRAERGPGMRPVTVNSFSEFVEMFGNPVPGGEGGDIWRDGNRTAPTYAAYAAQAWLRNAAPLTFIRLLGHQHDNAQAEGAAGWNADGGAYGLFIGEREAGTVEAVAGVAAAADIGALRYTRSVAGVNTDTLTITLVEDATLPGDGGTPDGTIAVSVVGTTITVTHSNGNDAGAINSNLITELAGGSITAALLDPADAAAAIDTGSADFGSAVAGVDAVAEVLDDNAPMALAAVIYRTDEGAPVDGEFGLSGQSPAGVDVAGKLNTFVKLQGTDSECKLKIGAQSYSVNFNRASKKHIRSVLNTNPTLTNAAITRSPESYFLGETYESHLDATVGSLGADNGMAVLVKLSGAGGTLDKADHQQGAQAPATGWVLSQHLGLAGELAESANGDYESGVTKLFRLEGLDDGAWASSNVKVEISDIVPADGEFRKYGSFTITLRSASDSDSTPKYLERYSSCNLNPASTDFVARRIGDMKSEWSYAENRYRTVGQYPSLSRFVRVVMNEDVAAGVTDPGLIPFGFQGPPSPVSIELTAGNGLGSGTAAETSAIGEAQIVGAVGELSKVTLHFPAQACRNLSSDGQLASPTQASFGATSNESGGSNVDASYGEMLRPWSANADNHNAEAKDGTQLTKPALRSASGVVANFTLDDLKIVTALVGAETVDTEHAQWVPGSRADGTSISAGADFKEVLDAGFDSFCMPLVGGTDGVNITHKEPFSQAALADGAPQTNYAYNSVKRAIDSIADPEVVECNLAVMPGINNKGLTGHLLNTCEARADTLAIIDIEGDYRPNTDNIVAESRRLPDVAEAVKSLKDRRINSSYGCAYFPWVQVRDTISDAVLWSPPSVVALGTMASSQRKTEVWFAPAGFNRGGLTEGSAGIPVSQVRYRLTSRERDALYEANINPIATFPSEGIVVFGQKTLQVTPSALDRVNVRRLMIYLKKEISRISATILFDQNTQVTWQRFTGQVEPLLASVRSRFGLSDFRVILDETTTTPDLVDRNVMYAKIMLKPTKAIEFIALDFVITRSGASFED